MGHVSPHMIFGHYREIVKARRGRAVLADLAASTGGECRADGEGHCDDCGLKGYRSIIEHLGISSIGAPPGNAPRSCAARILTDAMPNVEPT
jgi:hypothetical protein